MSVHFLPGYVGYFVWLVGKEGRLLSYVEEMVEMVIGSLGGMDLVGRNRVNLRW